MDFLEFAKGALAKSDFRITSSRISVIRILAETKRPLNAYDILRLLSEKRFRVDISTIYRILEVFQIQGIVHYVKDAQGFMPCLDFACKTDSHCHHQFVCRGCDAVKEFHFDDHEFVAAIKKKFSDFQFDEHYFEFAGLCPTCIAAKKV